MGKSGNIESQEPSKEMLFKSLLGEDLPVDWPKILESDEEAKAYTVLKDPEEDPADPSKYAHIDRLSYDLVNGNKRLRFFATFHQQDMKPGDPNLKQYEVLERKFNESPPELVLYEGIIDDLNHPLTRERALSLGEQAWVLYLVQQHNASLNEGEKPIVIESGDAPVNTESDNRIRDEYIVRNAAKKFKEYDRIDMVFGSGHSVRERLAWEQYFGKVSPQ